MRIQDRVSFDDGSERITLVPESVDDLWHLRYVLEPGDHVAGHSSRRIQRNDEELRDTGGEREHIFCTIDAAEIEFHRFANRLRVSGRIADASREDVLGEHHTLNVEERDELEVQKHWKPDQLERIQDAVAATDTPDVAVATIEEGEASVHSVAQHGVEERASITGPTGKGEFSRAREALFGDLTAVLERLDVDAVILAGPGFTKQDAYAYLEDEAPAVASQTTMVDTSAAGGRGVHEVLTRGTVEEIQAETRIAEEAALIDELTRQIATEGKASYGVEDVEQATEFGAVETLLVLDDRLRKERGTDGDWDVEIDEIVESVEQQGGDVVVFSQEFEPGQQLRNLGGIAAVLRYRLQ